jgi:hypothetical protein
VRLLDQIRHLQEALWRHARIGHEEWLSTSTTIPFRLDPTASDSLPSPVPIQRQKRAYHRKHPERPQWWRTRLDPFAEVWGSVEAWLEAQPDLTGVAVFKRLQKEYPDLFTDTQLRRLQRRVAQWRALMVTTFDDQWLQSEVLAGAALPLPLRAVSSTRTGSVATGAGLLAAGQAEQPGCSAAG